MNLVNKIDIEEIKEIDLWKEFIYNDVNFPFFSMISEYGVCLFKADTLDDLILQIYMKSIREIEGHSDDDYEFDSHLNLYKKDMKKLMSLLEGIDYSRYLLKKKVLEWALMGDTELTKYVLGHIETVVQLSKTMKSLKKKDFVFDFKESKQIVDLEVSGKEWDLGDIDVYEGIREYYYSKSLKDRCVKGSIFETFSDNMEKEIRKGFTKRIPNIFWDFVFLFVHRAPWFADHSPTECESLSKKAVKILENLNIKVLLTTVKKVQRPRVINHLLCFLTVVFGDRTAQAINEIEYSYTKRHNIENVIETMLWRHDDTDFMALDLCREFVKKIPGGLQHGELISIFTSFAYVSNLENKITVNQIRNCNDVYEIMNIVTKSAGSFSEWADEFSSSELGEEILDMYEKGLLKFSGLMEKVSKVSVVSGQYECSILDKLDTTGFDLGRLTNCCQSPGGVGETCTYLGYVDPCSGFMVFKKCGKIFGQGWVYVIDDKETLIIDNIETLCDEAYVSIMTKLLIGFSIKAKKLGIMNIQLGMGYNGNSFKSQPVLDDFIFPESFRDVDYYTDANDRRIWIMRDGVVLLKGVAGSTSDKKENTHEEVNSDDVMPTIGDLLHQHLKWDFVSDSDAEFFIEM